MLPAASLGFSKDPVGWSSSGGYTSKGVLQCMQLNFFTLDISIYGLLFCLRFLFKVYKKWGKIAWARSQA